MSDEVDPLRAPVVPPTDDTELCAPSSTTDPANKSSITAHTPPTEPTGTKLSTFPLADGGWLLHIDVPEGRMYVEYDADFDVTVLWGRQAATLHVGPVLAPTELDEPTKEQR